MLATERQHALTATNANDEPAFGEDYSDLAGFRSAWRHNTDGQQQCRQSNDRNSR
jgi:hypothetical protein